MTFSQQDRELVRAMAKDPQLKTLRQIAAAFSSKTGRKMTKTTVWRMILEGMA